MIAYLAVGGLLPPAALAFNVVDELLACHQMQRSQQRLACFDALATAVSEGTVARIPVEDIDAGFGLPADGSGPQTLGSEIARLDPAPRERFVITLKNDQVWREIESSRRPRYRVGDLVTLTRTFTGGYRLTVDRTGFTARVERVH